MVSEQLEAALGLIAWSSINPIVLVDLDLNILWCNKQFSELFGKDCAIKKLLSLNKTTSSPGILSEISEGTRFLKEFCLAGTAINYNINFSPIKQGAKLFYMLEFIIKQEVAATIKNVELADILRTFSFQIRSPLSKISNVAEAMEWEKSDQEQTTKSQIEAINSGCKQLLRSFSNFVDLTKYSMGLFELELSFVSVPNFLRSLVSSCASQPAANQIPIKLHIKDEKVYANFDEKKITLALANIIANSCMYTKDGNQIDIYLQADKKAKDLKITIKDRGIGMSEEICKKACVPYFAGNTVSSAPLTQGLGLTLVDHIVALHNGKLKISSQESVGTSVQITLPLNLDGDSKGVLSSPALQYPERFSIVSVQLALNKY